MVIILPEQGARSRQANDWVDVDFSKLPKLSETPPEPQVAAQPTAQAGRPREVAVGAEAWISFGLGALLIFLSNRPLLYLFSHSHPDWFNWTFFDKDGTPIPYLQSVFFLPDIGVCALGFIMIIDGLQMLLARSLKFAILAFLLTCAGTLLNVAALAVCLQNGTGFQLLSFLAIILGGYTAIYQRNAVQSLRHARLVSTDV